jgi:hypothetical protein
MNNNDPAYKSARNNAIWALGEISLRWTPESMELYIDTILQALIRLILTAAPSVSIYENAVITVGRLGIHFTQAVAKHLADFSHAWLYRARQLRENEERDSAFRGFCKTSIANPQAHNDIVKKKNLRSWGCSCRTHFFFLFRPFVYYLI